MKILVVKKNKQNNNKKKTLVNAKVQIQSLEMQLRVYLFCFFFLFQIMKGCANCCIQSKMFTLLISIDEQCYFQHVFFFLCWRVTWKQRHSEIFSFQYMIHFLCWTTQQHCSKSPTLHNKCYNSSKQLNDLKQNLYISNAKVPSIFFHCVQI